MKFFVISILATMFGAMGPAHATSCRSEAVSIEERAKRADVIFVGKFIRHIGDIKDAPRMATRATKLKIKRVYKGILGGDETVIYYKKSRPGCALDYFSLFNFGGEKEDLLIFAMLEDGKLYTNEKFGSGFVKTSAGDIKYLNSGADY